MRVYRGLPPLADRRPCVVTIGNFDGVHRGHQHLLAMLREQAQQRGLASCVLTFEPHPREYFQPEQAPARLSSLRDKLIALQAHHIDQVILLKFNARLAKLSAEEFVRDILIQGVGAQGAVIGDDFRFGAKRQGDLALLSQVGQRLVGAGFQVQTLETTLLDGERVSSSALRDALRQGDFQRCSGMLGRAYTLSGHVIHGQKLGRQLGFPTLNLRAPKRPAVHGIFAVKVHGLDAAPLMAVASLGHRPTVMRDGAPLLEVHVFDWQGDAYGQVVTVEFVDKIRDELHFDHLDALKDAIAEDCARARSILHAEI